MKQTYRSTKTKATEHAIIKRMGFGIARGGKEIDPSKETRGFRHENNVYVMGKSENKRHVTWAERADCRPLEMSC